MVSDELTGLMIITMVLVIILLLWFGFNSYSKKCEIPQHECLTVDDALREPMEDQPAPVADESATFEDYIQKTAVADSVVHSHKRFISEAPHRTTVSSKNSLVDHDSGPVKFWGLRRPKYQSKASTQFGSRVASSESPDQLAQYRPYQLN
jgi:hypothetical protein